MSVPLSAVLVAAIGLLVMAALVILPGAGAAASELAALRRELLARPTHTPDELASFEARLARLDPRMRSTARRRLLRPLVAGAVVLVVGIVLTPTPATALGITLIVLGPVAVGIAAIVGARGARTRAEAAAADLAEAAALLERARIPGRGPVPGLRDRISRALAILRDQQR